MHLLHAIIQYRSSVGFKSPVVIRGEGVVDVIGYFRVTRIAPKSVIMNFSALSLNSPE